MIIPLRVPSPMFFGGLDHSFFYLSLWMKSFGVTIEMNSLEQYYCMVLFTEYTSNF